MFMRPQQYGLSLEFRSSLNSALHTKMPGTLNNSRGISADVRDAIMAYRQSNTSLAGGKAARINPYTRQIFNNGQPYTIPGCIDSPYFLNLPGT